MSKKDQEKLKIDVIRLINLRGLVLSQRSEFKKKEQFALEVSFDYGSEVNYLIFNDIYNMMEWQENLEKSVEFSQWLRSLIELTRDHNKDLTDQLRAKTTQIMSEIQVFDPYQMPKIIDFIENAKTKKR